MAWTTAQTFNDFESKIALSEAERSKVKNRKDVVTSLLRSTFPSSCSTPLKYASLMGSAQRGTAIRPLDDIDVLAVFSNKGGVFEKYRHNSQNFLYSLRNRINAKTAVQSVGSRGQAVRLFYVDGLHVDIAPVFEWQSGGFALPSGTGSWISTDPPRQETWVEERERELGGQFKRRVRLAKRWNVAHSKRLGSWHLEVVVGSCFSSMSSNHREGMAKFFEFAAPYLHVQDPDGHGGDLGANLTSHQQSAIRDSLESSRVRAQLALSAEAIGDHAEAIRLWRILFGDGFPAYG